MTTASLPILNGTRFKAHFETELNAAQSISVLQINIGYVCNLACRHCHVESSPAKTSAEDNMSKETAQRVIVWTLNQSSIKCVDFTGGSPEMNPNFRWMVETFRKHKLSVIDRCNPTIITHTDKKTNQSYEWIPQFLADNQVQIVASLPCYLEENVDHQRGRGSYNASVEGLLLLNSVGYGTNPELPLNLVFNPTGPQLPPPQKSLEADYKRELRARFGIVFNELWTITNMPIKRWRHELDRTGKLEEYMNLLTEAHNPQTIEGLMCRHQISIDPQGRLFDCDFNQALEMSTPNFVNTHIWETSVDKLANRVIATDDHCYGCTAGCGSSCGGALT